MFVEFLTTILSNRSIFIHLFGGLRRFQHCTGHISQQVDRRPRKPVHTAGQGSVL